MIDFARYGTGFVALVGLVICCGVQQRPAVAEEASYPIAGVAPYERPAGAPTIDKFVKGTEWYEGALVGLTQPYPQSFRFLEDQEAWHTPFTHPGMTGPYDLRGWHQNSTGKTR